MKKFESIVHGLSFGEQYLVASLVYLGLSLILIASMPEMKVALADDEECICSRSGGKDENGKDIKICDECPEGEGCTPCGCLKVGKGCCNGNVYDTATQDCCGGKVVYNLEIEGCCEGQKYTKATEQCCCCGVIPIEDCCCVECSDCGACEVAPEDE